MKNFRNLIDQFYLASNYVLVFSFPFPKQVFNVAILIWLLAFVLKKASNLQIGFKKIGSTPLAISFVALFLLITLGLYFSEDVDAGKFVLEKYLFFIVCPIILVDLKGSSNPHFHKRLYLTFIASCVLFLIYTMIKTTIESSILNLLLNEPKTLAYKWSRVKYVYSYQRFAQYGGTHAVYLTSYLIFGFFLCLNLMKNESSKMLVKALKFCSVFLVFFIFTLQSAMLFFAFAILILLYFIVENPKIKKGSVQLFFILLFIISGIILCVKADINPYSIKGIGLLALLGVFGFILPNILSVLRRLKIKAWMIIAGVIGLIVTIFILVESPKVEKFAEDHPSNVAARYWKWKSATNIIKDSPWVGTGTGDTQNLLIEEYKILNFESGLKYNYNEHNQYLRFWMENGILALLVFLFILYLALKQSIKQSYFPMIVLVCLLIFFSFTESDLCRRSGVTFFVYFLVLFSYFPDPKITNIEHE